MKCILIGDIKKHIELREEEIKTYDEMRQIVMKWAINKKIEKDKGHAPMDIGKVEEAQERAKVLEKEVRFPLPEQTTWEGGKEYSQWETFEGGDWVLETSWEQEEDVNMVSKGGGKGKFGKAGKGPMQQKWVWRPNQKGTSGAGAEGQFGKGGQ